MMRLQENGRDCNNVHSLCLEFLRLLCSSPAANRTFGQITPMNRTSFGNKAFAYVFRFGKPSARPLHDVDSWTHAKTRCVRCTDL